MATTPISIGLKRRLGLVVLAGLFLFGQVVAQQHVHTADEPVESCLICGHLDSGLDTAGKLQSPAQQLLAEDVAAPSPISFTRAEPAAYLSRAPPTL